jgi:hypothetical protein
LWNISEWLEALQVFTGQHCYLWHVALGVVSQQLLNGHSGSVNEMYRRHIRVVFIESALDKSRSSQRCNVLLKLIGLTADITRSLEIAGICVRTKKLPTPWLGHF